MGRLIDEDALIEVLNKNSIFSKITNVEGKNTIEIINEQPTAYDVGAVIAGLKKESFQEWCDSPKIVELNDAIYIVRMGGVED